ncbi:MAG: cryptochrome/photolyase family protein, partial [Ilumatobacter sp.]|nr:cryptochrome/photolyase family protein [Ilumatobacter sp.]
METVWVLGDQLNRSLGALGVATPADHRVLVVESTTLLRSKRWHRQRAHLVVAGMRRFVAELRAEGFDVDHRRAAGLEAGFEAHVAEHRPARVSATTPTSFDGRALLGRLGVELAPTGQFLTDPDDFAAWAGQRGRVTMEDFY